MTDEQKQVCTCMGINIFSMCNFPGIQLLFFLIENPALQPVAKQATIPISSSPLLNQGETLDQFLLR